MSGPGDGDYRGHELDATAHARRYNAWIMQFLRPHLGACVIEVGAGTGSFTRELLSASPEKVIAVEPSAWLFPVLQRRLDGEQHVDVRHGTLGSVLPEMEGAADTVVYVNVLEHIDDHATELRDVARVLRPGGTVCLFVPALPWLTSRFDRDVGHHRRYRREELVRLVEAAGLVVEDARYFDMLGIAIWFVAMRMMRMQMGAARVRTYDRLVVPVARLLDRLAGPPAGKSLIVVARRPR